MILGGRSQQPSLPPRIHRYLVITDVCFVVKHVNAVSMKLWQFVIEIWLWKPWTHPQIWSGKGTWERWGGEQIGGTSVTMRRGKGGGAGRSPWLLSLVSTRNALLTPQSSTSSFQPLPKTCKMSTLMAKWFGKSVKNYRITLKLQPFPYIQMKID